MTPKQKQATQRNWQIYMLRGNIRRLELLLHSAVLTEDEEPYAVDAIASMKRLLEAIKAIPGRDTRDHTAA